MTNPPLCVGRKIVESGVRHLRSSADRYPSSRPPPPIVFWGVILPYGDRRLAVYTLQIRKLTFY
jgi:hypothetical protein